MNPDLRRLLAWAARRAEPLAFSAAALLLLALAWSGGRAGAPWAALLYGAGGLAAASVALVAWQRARLGPGGEGPGLVAVAERRIAWFGPEGGGFVDLESLRAVEIRRPGPGELGAAGPVWRLLAEGGGHLDVPASARDAERLADALAPLAGLDWPAAARALAGEGPTVVRVWERRRSPGSHLASPPPAAY